MTRPDREVVLRLLAASGSVATVRTTELLEDVDGVPAGVEVTEESGVLVISPRLLGWTWEELGIDPEDDET